MPANPVTRAAAPFVGRVLGRSPAEVVATLDCVAGTSCAHQMLPLASVDSLPGASACLRRTRATGRSPAAPRTDMATKGAARRRLRHRLGVGCLEQPEERGRIDPRRAGDGGRCLRRVLRRRRRGFCGRSFPGIRAAGSSAEVAKAAIRFPKVFSLARVVVWELLSGSRHRPQVPVEGLTRFGALPPQSAGPRRGR